MFKCFKRKKIQQEVVIVEKRRNSKCTTNKHLVVDDSDMNRYVLQNHLEIFDIQVDDAINGLDCVEKYKNYKDYDIIWMDLQMPEMNGFDAAKKLREMGYQKYIIALTGHVDKESTKKCLQSGMDFVLAKPIFKNEFYAFLYEKFGFQK
jgi:CheY-like chemotaxis protein